MLTIQKQNVEDQAASFKWVDDINQFKDVLVMSSQGGQFELSEEQRLLAAVFKDSECIGSEAIILISKDAENLLISIQNTLVRAGVGVKSVYHSHANHIAELYKANRVSTIEINNEISSLIELIVKTSVKENVSDIHISLTDTGMSCNLRKDGIIRGFKSLTKESGMAFLRAVFQLEKGNQDIHFQASKIYTYGFDWMNMRLRCVNIPTSPGNCLQVWRVIDKNVRTSISIDDCGYDEVTASALAYLSELSDGLNIISGPTNSGKSTTLQKLIAHYTKLHRQPDGTYGMKTYTLDNVIEYQIPGADQIEVQISSGASQEEILKAYTNVMAAILRADPDCVSMNEIRSSGEGKMLTDLVDTGRKAFVTLHAKDTFSTAKRAIEEFKFNPNVFSYNGIVNSILSQKLIPTLCVGCRVPASTCFDSIHKQPFVKNFVSDYVDKLDGVFTKSENGCDECDHTGYVGRKLVYELFIPSELNKDVCELIEKKDIYKAQELWLNRNYNNGIDGISIAERHLQGMFAGDFCLYDTVRFVSSNLVSSRLKVKSMKLIGEQNAQ